MEKMRWAAVAFGLYALVRLTLEARGRGRFPLGVLFRDWFGCTTPEYGTLAAGLLLGTALVVLPTTIRVASGTVDLVRLPTDSSWLPLALASLLLKAAFVLFEETISRGAIITLLDRRFPTGLAVLISAALFGLAHSARPAHGFVVLGLDGVLFGALFVASGRLWLPAAAHFGKNAAVWLIGGGGTVTVAAGLFDLVSVGGGISRPAGAHLVELSTTAALTLVTLLALKLGNPLRESGSRRDSRSAGRRRRDRPPDPRDAD